MPGNERFGISAKIIVTTRSWRKRWSAVSSITNLLLEDASGNVRAIQPVFFVQQNLVEGVPGKIRSIVDGIRKIPRLLHHARFDGWLRSRHGRPRSMRRKRRSVVADALQASLGLRQEKESSLSVSRIFRDYRQLDRERIFPGTAFD